MITKTITLDGRTFVLGEYRWIDDLNTIDETIDFSQLRGGSGVKSGMSLKTSNLQLQTLLSSLKEWDWKADEDTIKELAKVNEKYNTIKVGDLLPINKDTIVLLPSKTGKTLYNLAEELNGVSSEERKNLLKQLLNL